MTLFSVQNSKLNLNLIKNTFSHTDGRVTNKQPWGLTKIYGFFMGIIMGIVLL